VRRIVLHDTFPPLLVARAEDARDQRIDVVLVRSADSSAASSSVRNSWSAYRAGRTSGVKVCVVQMP
jgi:hypothetical protein